MNKSIYFEFYKLKTPYFPSRRFPKSRCVNFDASFARYYRISAFCYAG